MTELPKYKCHKEVRALKIADGYVSFSPAEAFEGGYTKIA